MREKAIEIAEKKYVRPEGKLPEFKSGDTVKVHSRIREGDKERTQVFEGVVIRIHRSRAASTFTVRKMSYGVGVERIFPTHSPRVEKIEVVASSQVKRARLYYLRGLAGKAARLKEESSATAPAAPSSTPSA